MDAGSVVYSIRNEKLRKSRGEMVGDLGKIGVKHAACRYEVGDLVWGKVRSHPWWPGQILHEAFALPCVSKTKRDGHVLVAFFGDNTYGWFNQFDLMPYDISYFEKSKQTNDSEFVKALEDAEDEARRVAALGLSCQCRGTNNFRATVVKGFIEVDVCGYQPAGVYSVKQIKNARDWFQPSVMLCFLKDLASIPHGNLERSINLIKNGAVVLAYRKAMFEEVDETYAQACGTKPVHGENSIGILNSRLMPSEVHTSASGIKTLGSAFLGKKATTAKDKSVLEETSLIKSLDHRKAERVKSWDVTQDFQQPQQKVCKAEKISRCLENFQVVGRTPPPLDAALHREVIVTSSDISDEKPRVSKCLEEELHSEQTLMMNKKKRKKECKFEAGLEYLQNHHRTENKKSGNGARGIFSSDQMAREKVVGLKVNSKVPQLLGYLSALALDPFQCVQQNIPTTMLQFFLRFRSVVSMKVVVAPAAEAETIESCPTKALACGMASKSPYSTAKDLPCALKPLKKRLKADDYGNLGLNDRITGCERMFVEEPKRLSELKALTEEKTLAGDGKLVKPVRRGARMSVKVPKMLTKYSHKKPDTSTSVTEPKMIVIQFPCQSALPSVSELKARFARFGQLQYPRVFWKSSTCQVPFKCKSDAEAAFAYAIKNQSLFGNAKVEYFLQALESSSSVLPRPDKQLVGDATDEAPQDKPARTGESTKPMSIAPQHQVLHPSFEPKSCLTKQLNEHVKFILSGQENTSRELIVGESIIKNSDYNHSNGNSSSCATFNTNAKTSEKVHKMLYFPPDARNNCVDAAASSSSSSQSMDISDQMLSLLIRCHEIVADLKSSFGYVPIKL